MTPTNRLAIATLVLIGASGCALAPTDASDPGTGAALAAAESSASEPGTLGNACSKELPCASPLFCSFLNRCAVARVSGEFIFDYVWPTADAERDAQVASWWVVREFGDPLPDTGGAKLPSSQLKFLPTGFSATIHELGRFFVHVEKPVYIVDPDNGDTAKVKLAGDSDVFTVDGSTNNIHTDVVLREVAPAP